MEYIEKCLSSVTKSEYQNLEIILVDNGSTDGSIEYVFKKFGQDHRIKVIINDRNYGYAKGNNIALKYVQGKYVVFLNIDTEVDPH
jgi:GT2 family glycosyltransferase